MSDNTANTSDTTRINTTRPARPNNNSDEPTEPLPVVPTENEPSLLQRINRVAGIIALIGVVIQWFATQSALNQMAEQVATKVRVDIDVTLNPFGFLGGILEYFSDHPYMWIVLGFTVFIAYDKRHFVTKRLAARKAKRN